METKSQPRVYGDRARIGLVVPSTNTVAEIEFWRMAPDGVTVHTSRMPFLPKRYDDPLAEMEQHVPRVLEEAVSAEPDVIAYGCTASSAKGDPEIYRTKLCAHAGTETLTAAGALVAALGALGATRVVLVTPYPQSVNDHECEFFAGQGIEVLADESVIVDEAQRELRHMSRVGTGPLVEAAVRLASRHQPDAVVLSCCDMPTLDAIPAIERATGLPVISSAQALFWQALRSTGVTDSVPTAGQLLSR